MNLTTVQQDLLAYFNLVKTSTLINGLRTLKSINIKNGCNLPVSKEDFRKEISEINLYIKRYDMEIIEAVCETRNTPTFVLINMVDNTISRNSKFLDKHTTLYFSKILKECIMSQHGRVTEMQCIALNNEIGLSKSAANNILNKLITEKWIISQDGELSLTMRAIIELQEKIRASYSSYIVYCHFCKLIVIQGYHCLKCKLKFHSNCVAKYSNQKKLNCFCPNCKDKWDTVPLDIKEPELLENEDEETTEYISIVETGEIIENNDHRETGENNANEETDTNEMMSTEFTDTNEIIENQEGVPLPFRKRKYSEASK